MNFKRYELIDIEFQDRRIDDLMYTPEYFQSL